MVRPAHYLHRYKQNRRIIRANSKKKQSVKIKKAPQSFVFSRFITKFIAETNIYHYQPINQTPMKVWILIVSVLVLAFMYKVYKAMVKIRRKGSANYHIPVMRTRKKRTKFFRRFKYLEGLGD